MIIFFYRRVSDGKITHHSIFEHNLSNKEVQAKIWEYNENQGKEKVFAINTEKYDYIEYLIETIDRLKCRNKNIINETLKRLYDMSGWVKGWKE